MAETDAQLSEMEEGRHRARSEKELQRICGFSISLLALVVGTMLFLRGAATDAEIGRRLYRATECPEILKDGVNVAAVHFTREKFRVGSHACRHITNDELNDTPLDQLCQQALQSVNNTKLVEVDKRCDGCVHNVGKIRHWSSTMKVTEIILFTCVIASLLSYIVAIGMRTGRTQLTASYGGVAFSFAALLSIVIFDVGVASLRYWADTGLEQVLMTTPFFQRLSACPDSSSFKSGRDSDSIPAAILLFLFASFSLLYFTCCMSDDQTQEEESQPLIMPRS